MRRIYVETLIKATVDDVWWHTQEPVMHARWDGRFGEISYLPATEPQRFRYATFGMAGIGITTGERIRSDGGGTSSLSFFSANPLSPIRSGSGYWRYVPTPAGVIFLTGYDYRPGWGWAGDLVVRPLMGWLTAWSFDRLRLWLETGMRPEHSRNQALAEVVARAGLVLAAGTLGGAAAVLAATVVAIVPPLPGTPAARRCRRTPRDHASYSSSLVTDDRLGLP